MTLDLTRRQPQFTDVRRVFEVIKTSPKFQLADQSEEMMEAETLAAPAPQGLRFPSAFRTGDWLVWSGVYIASNVRPSSFVSVGDR